VPAIVAAVIAGVLLVAGILWWSGPTDPSALAERAEAEAKAGRWQAALGAWRAVNATSRARGSTHLAEARACLKLDLAAQAEAALRRATMAGPSDPDAWRTWLDLLRVEDRPLDAIEVGWAAYRAVPPASRGEILRALTLALLAAPPEDLVRETLARWSRADPADLDARSALDRAIADAPRGDDPGRPDRIAVLSALLAHDPGHAGLREALVIDLAEAGEPDRGRSLLDAWPEARRDARYLRLKGRWDLEYDRRPDRAVAAFESSLVPLPHDVRTHYRLARSLANAARPAAAREAAARVSALRELLDPIPLGRRLAADLKRPRSPASLRDLAALCREAGLTRLADAWDLEASNSPATDLTADPGDPTMAPGDARKQAGVGR
jgi:predicted Zn-dependent protease